MEKKGDLSGFEHVMVVGARQASLSISETLVTTEVNRIVSLSEHTQHVEP